jgi:hypothetical protein
VLAKAYEVAMISVALFAVQVLLVDFIGDLQDCDLHELWWQQR